MISAVRLCNFRKFECCRWYALQLQHSVQQLECRDIGFGLLRAAIRKSSPSVEQLINAAHQEHRINRSWHSPLPRKCVLWRMSPHRAQAVDVRTWLSCGKLGARDHVLIRDLRADRGSSHITAEAQAVHFRAGSRSRRRWTISARQWLGWSKHASVVR